MDNSKNGTVHPDIPDVGWDPHRRVDRPSISLPNIQGEENCQSGIPYQKGVILDGGKRKGDKWRNPVQRLVPSVPPPSNHDSKKGTHNVGHSTSKFISHAARLTGSS
ncbi:hypothetical protein N7474_003738 [Penicillium riverlandense]|uniref:uncharacterized protein n=1 Tax=Penicillium riverlandense TaxID=1903569 RepID=UPI002548EB1F|nr:uncharacterized protein N7474_003738 [Penicillium riverlandense]KAJ5818147.1 hypothetical protein N7474_003738 [Penicillium riverlandense]